jgi:hypothetical protein
MSVIYRALVFAIATLTCSFAYSSTLAEPANAVSKGLLQVSGARCNASAECTLELDGADRIVKDACDSPGASLTWNNKREGAFLIVCECECTSHDNTGWLIDMKPKSGIRNVQGLYLGKKTTVEGLMASVGSISDMFASHPLCENVDSKKSQQSVFVSLIKQPTQSESHAYCFYPAYIMEDNGALIMRTDNSQDGFGKLLQVEDEKPELEAEILEFLDDLVVKGHI